MLDAAPAVCLVLGGCQANMFLLELIVAKNRDTMYAMTFAQYVAVALLSLPYVCTFRKVPGKAHLLPLQMRPGRLSTLHKLAVGVTAWVMGVATNLAFNMHVSVPVHSTFRSLPLLLNMLVGFFFLNKRYTFLQVACVSMITVGLVLLTVEKSRRSSRSTTNGSSGTQDTSEYFWCLCGMLILLFTTVLSTALSLMQEHMYKTAERREKALETESKKTDNPKMPRSVEEATETSPAPMWAEALFFSHAVGIPLFLSQPSRLFTEFASVSSENYVYFLLNAVTQYMCVMGVYVLNNKTSAFTLVLILTLRKLGTFTLSVIYFGHYRHFNTTEWIAMFGALGASVLYPLLPKA
ncbi:hypothetical protein, conserved [Trypanosoma brucei gambiense DAL972]|uniref:UDP-galactose transporter n=2 Tax=Trypanosoma brucei TaxID=5691 RepID=D0A561_TRYB9|nr:hypothetical protein, conserved [Trypanosoma brucei gambiense DAL972]RHW68865.1 UAA transporter family [Trypanosoma brucei equiperdum]CBH16405.1 hypothetical protein, conserved [Trypanosoma brucei gambiense DAL972]|eukprot:XP_011778669.1 hypothetical protein, conserved [Trypanosoma brucei gambiense DAL972]